MIREIAIVARLELLAVGRLRWIRLLAAAFGLLAVAAAYSAGAAAELGSPDGFARTTMALVPVMLVLVPLAAVVLGVAGQTAESGGEAFLFAQPVARGVVIVGRWAGEAAALGTAIVAGLGAGAAFIVFNAGADALGGFLFFTLASVLLGMIFLAMAAAVAAATDHRAAALGVGTFVWFFFVLLYDGAALSLAGWITGAAGGRVLLVSVFGNPADLVRVLTLTFAGTPHVLGAAGDAWSRLLGGPAAASAWALTALAAWTVAPLALAVRLIDKRDL
jgi:Cu-processing system permease protein